MQDGLIVKALSGFYYVQPDEGGGTVQCRARGLFKKQGIAPLVGDRVKFERDESGSVKGEGTVVELYPRSTELVRPPVANVDTALLVFAVTEPELNVNLLDKFLVLAELAGLEPVIGLTKSELLHSKYKTGQAAEALRAKIGRLQSVYEAIGYRVFSVSARSGEGTDALLALLDGRITVFAGQSGVGKSSLLNCLVPGLTLETNEISQKLGRGKHTTRHVELYRIGASGLVADTPGFSQLEFPDVEPERLTQAFPEFAKLAGSCKFRGCLHLQEPSCRVRDAVERQEADSGRYENYTMFLTEIKERKRRYPR